MRKKSYLSELKYSLNSISSRLVVLVLLVVIPLTALFLYSNNQTRAILIKQVETTHENMLQSYGYQIDLQLGNALSDVIGLVIQENDPFIIASDSDSASAQYAKIRLSEKLDKMLLTNNYIGGYFMYIPEPNGYVNFLYSSNLNYASPARNALWDFVDSCVLDLFPENQWQLCSFDGEDYLFLISGNNNIHAGSFIRLSALLPLFAPSSVPGSHLYLLPSDSWFTLTEQAESGILSVNYPLAYADLVLAESFSQSEILKDFPILQKYTNAVALLILLMVILLLFFIRRIVTIPLLRLTDAMKEIQSGNLDFRIAQPRATAEIGLVNNTFNHMANEIQNLKISVYEQQLSAQKAQLRNLQLQIKPHFLINSLNMIYNLIETNHLPTARQLILHSVDFFRYMVKVDADLVPLNEEISHVKAYLNIQSLRYENQFVYHIAVDPMVHDALVPPVIVQTFVENSCKYALASTDMLQIDIVVSSFEKNYVPYVKILIRDNGAGYPEEYLDAINKGSHIIKSDGIHIGMRNTVQRLRILFEEGVSWHFYNQKGAVAEFVIPASFTEEEEDDLLD